MAAIISWGRAKAVQRKIRAAGLVAATVFAAALCASSPSGAEDFPARPVRLIVPLSAGSAFDVLARAMGAAFEQRTRQPFIVENRPGGNMAVGANACKSAAADGYTVCLLTQNAITLNPLL